MYSKITSVELINFMVYEHARITFDERGIINLKGYNSSGKSTFERAIAVCLMDAFKRKQQKFIRHGEDYFRVVVEFDDGVRIVRDKYLNGQSLYEMYKENELLYTTKEGSKLTKVDEVPEIIQKYLGLITIEGGCLNYQSRRDPLWLIETSGGDNYYALNEVLKTESIARANAMLNSDKNKLNSEIVEIENELQSTEIALNNCGEVTEELLAVLSEREIYAQGISSKNDKIGNISDTLDRLLELKMIPEVGSISSSRLSAILEIEKNLLELEKVIPVPKMEKLEVEKVKKISKLLSNVSELKDAFNTTISVNIDKVSYEQLPLLSKLSSSFKELASCVSSYKDIKKEEKSVSDNLSVVVKDAHDRGIKFVKCDNCGAYMEVGESVGGK